MTSEGHQLYMNDFVRWLYTREGHSIDMVSGSLLGRRAIDLMSYIDLYDVFVPRGTVYRPGLFRLYS